MTVMNEYEVIEKQIRVKLAELGKRPCHLSQALGIGQTLLWSRYMKGKVKFMTPKKLTELINEGISKL